MKGIGDWNEQDIIDSVDIPDEREPEHRIPDAVCDVQTGLGGELEVLVGNWLTERSRVSHLESIGLASSSDWHGVEDDAVFIVETLAKRFKVLPIIEPGTVVQSQGDLAHIGVVIEPFVRCNLPGWILVHWTHAGICDEHVRDVTVLGAAFKGADPDSALSIDECEAAGVDGTLRDM